MLTDRASEVADELLLKNDEYNKVSDKITELFHKIKALLP